MVEAPSQPPAIPIAGSQMHGSIGEAAVAVFTPILARQSGYVEGGAGQFRQIGDGARSSIVIQVLQHVVADHEVAAEARREVGHRALDPFVPRAQKVARLQAPIGGARDGFGERLAEQPDAAARIENAAHGYAGVFQNSGNEVRPAAHLCRRRNAGGGVEVVLAEVGGVEGRRRWAHYVLIPHLHVAHRIFLGRKLSWNGSGYSIQSWPVESWENDPLIVLFFTDGDSYAA